MQDCTESGFTLRISQEDWDHTEVRSAWIELIARSNDFDLLAKSPEMLDHCREFRGREQFHVATARDHRGQVVGVVPLRVVPSCLKVEVGGRVAWRSREPAVSILGSLPLLPADAGLHDLLFRAIDEAFPDCQAVATPSVPTSSFLWRYLRESDDLHRRFFAYSNHGIRRCHTIPLPSKLSEYRARFSAKKRYNLNRQVRLLREWGGGRLDLRRIESPDQVDRAFDELEAGGGLGPLEMPGSWTELGMGRFEAREMASRGLYLVYLLLCDGKPCAALSGLQYRGVFHLRSIPRDGGLDRFSPGATLLHLAIEDLIEQTSIRKIDLGYGEPASTHTSTNVIEPRASILLFRKTPANYLRLGGHSASQSLVGLGKSLLSLGRGTAKSV